MTTPTETPTPSATDKHIERCIGDCENAAAAPDDLAVICGKMTLRTVVAEAKRARTLERQLTAATAQLEEARRALGYYTNSIASTLAERDEARRDSALIDALEQIGADIFIDETPIRLPGMTMRQAIAAAMQQKEGK